MKKKLKETLFVGVLAVSFLSLFLFVLEPGNRLRRCSGDLSEPCLLEENSKYIEGLKAKDMKPSSGVLHQKGIFEREISNDTEALKYTEGLKATVPQRGFPPLYAAVLPNGLNCSKVWTGDARELRRARAELNHTLAASRPPDFYDTITENCSQYRQQNGFLDAVSQEEREFPLAFSVMVYKDAEQVERLLRAVYRPHNVYCLHPDLKTKPRVLEQIRALIHCLPNVVEAPRRVSVVWGKFSVLEPELICMEALWRMRSKWRYVINLTGQEFPLKTNKELVRILRAYRGANDILGEVPKKQNAWRWERSGAPPHGIAVAKGPVHVAASRGFVHFLLHAQVARDFLAWTRRTAIPDETFFASLNNLHRLKVPGAYTGNLTTRGRIMLNRFKIWDSSHRNCSGKFVRHICHFGLREVATLAHSRHFVANKFTYESSPLAYDCLEQWYFQRVRREETTGIIDMETRYYSNLQIVKHAFREANNSGIYAEEEDVMYG